MFKSIGDNCFFQPRTFPSDPELISIGNNVNISSGATFINHDILHMTFCAEDMNNDYVPFRGCIEIGNNVMIGANVTILPNVKIGNNVIIGAGSIVTRDLPDNTVCAGVPARIIGRYNEIKERRKTITTKTDSLLWDEFKKDKEAKANNHD